MDICRPNLIWINGSCYRKNPTSDDNTEFDHENTPTGGDAIDEYEDEVGCAGEFQSSELDDCMYIINEMAFQKGQFWAAFHVASPFFPIIIGKKGTTKKRIETETKTRINIPKVGVENEKIQVSGPSRFSVAMACNRIDSIVSSARQRQGFTHFLSLPMNHPEIQSAFLKFKESVMSQLDCNSRRGIDESVFQIPTLLHMTLGTLALMDDVEREQAAEILHLTVEKLDVKFLEHVQIKGLEIMNDDPSEVDVVYGRVHCEPLQSMAEYIVNQFIDTGFMPRQFDRIKLHVTLMNTKFRLKDTDEEESIPESRDKSRETMDVREVLEQFGDYDFGGEVAVKEIHLSQRRAGKRNKDGYYHPSTIAKFDLYEEFENVDD